MKFLKIYLNQEINSKQLYEIIEYDTKTYIYSKSIQSYIQNEETISLMDMDVGMNGNHFMHAPHLKS